GARSKAISASELRKALKEKLGDIEPWEKSTARLLWEKSGTEAIIEALAIETTPGVTLPLFILKPALAPSKRAPAVLAVAEGGKVRFLADRSEELMTLLRSGIEICLLDVRGT